MIAALLLSPLVTAAQEVLTPLYWAPVPARPTARKAAAQPLTLPFDDDFASGTMRGSHWVPQGGAVATFDVSPWAPTVGVMTLDALDAEGRLYPQATSSLFPADTATSVPLRLDGLAPADSVVLSFYYLPGGGQGYMWERMGDAPDRQDSLFLEFYAAADSSWRLVWSRGGTDVEELVAATGRSWQYVAVAVDDSAFFDSTFRFRFRNYASLEVTNKPGKAGNCDFWHIDCVSVDSARTTTAEPFVRDIAFAAPAPSMLAHYRAMPFEQYRPSEMAPAFRMCITNRYSSELASQYGYTVRDASGTVLHSYDGGYRNAPPFMLDGVYQTAAPHATPSVDYSFPLMDSPGVYTVVHVAQEGSGGDVFTGNDTVRYTQVFGHYYAYDDGSPENGYSLTSTSQSMLLAYRFDLNVYDTVTAVDIFFNPTQDSANSHIQFYLTLWSMGADGKPDSVLYRDRYSRLPQVGEFFHYELERMVPVPSGSLFVGFEQAGNDFINVGFDRSYNTADRIYQLTDDSWRQSYLSGSLMIRPCLGTRTMAAVRETAAVPEVRVFPNPADGYVVVQGEVKLLELLDMTGRRVACANGNRLETASVADGMYLIRMVGNDGMVTVKKLIISHR